MMVEARRVEVVEGKASEALHRCVSAEPAGGHLLESFHDMVTFADIAGALTFGATVGALADAGDPLPDVTVTRDGMTVTLSGTWVWPEQHDPCGPGTSANRAAGWAADWDDGFTGNFVKSKALTDRQMSIMMS